MGHLSGHLLLGGKGAGYLFVGQSWYPGAGIRAEILTVVCCSGWLQAAHAVDMAIVCRAGALSHE